MYIYDNYVSIYIYIYIYIYIDHNSYTRSIEVKAIELTFACPVLQSHSLLPWKPLVVVNASIYIYMTTFWS